jgi:hypothetical protein
MTLPGIGSLKELTVLRAFIGFFAEWSFTANTPKMIHDLVFQNSD